jgi:hypothetical protein
MTTRRTLLERALCLLGASWVLPRAAFARVDDPDPTASTEDDGTAIVGAIEGVLEPWSDAIDGEGSGPCFHPWPRWGWEEMELAMADFSVAMAPGQSHAPALLDIVFYEGETGTQLLAVIAYRRVGCEIAQLCRELLENEQASPQLRWLAAVSLGLSGPVMSFDTPAPLLARLAIERDPDVREAIGWALGQIAPGHRTEA